MLISDILLEGNAQLQALVTQDQAERKAYEQFVTTHANGDWEQGAKLYAKAKNRSPDDIFGEITRLKQFITFKFDFNKFSKKDWNNYWLLAQHCDFSRDFQKQALGNIEKHLGNNSKEYKYLADRISCGCFGTQKYNTQDICDKDELQQSLTEVSMAPGNLQGFLDSKFAQNATVGFEFELIVPGLEDITGYNVGIDESKNIPFPTGLDWKAKAFVWLTGGTNKSSNNWIIKQLDAFEEEFNDWKFYEYKKYIKTLPGARKVKSEIETIRNADGTNTPENVNGSLLATDNIYMQAVDNLKSKILDKKFTFKNFLSKEKSELKTMGDFCDEMALKFPYRYQYKAKTTIKKLAAGFEKSTKFNVESSKVYHAVDRKAGHWIFEPDGSIKDPTRQGAGVELVSPPMPLPEGLIALDTVWKWCESKNITTNDSTGMHINISIPNQTNIDYIKLILFLGDPYILKTFGREQNSYAQSMMKTLYSNLEHRTNIDDFLNTIKNGINKLAQTKFNSNLPHTTEKYVTVNIKHKYIEFRAAGGNYLENKALILNTLARYIKVLSIASDPNAEIEEYGKKLYKFIRTVISDDTNSINDVFLKFAAGKISLYKMKEILKRLNKMRKFRNKK